MVHFLDTHRRRSSWTSTVKDCTWSKITDRNPTKEFEVHQEDQRSTLTSAQGQKIGDIDISSEDMTRTAKTGKETLQTEREPFSIEKVTWDSSASLPQREGD